MISTLVLTAGLGTRLDPITRVVAKPAVPLGDRTLVEHVLAWVWRQGVREVVLNLHHRPDSITAILGDGTHLGLSVRYSWEDLILGSAGGPRLALPLLATDPFLIVNGDTLCDFDLEPMIEAHRTSGADVTMAVVPNLDPEHYNGMHVGPERELLGFVPRGRATGTWHFVGVQVVNKAVFGHLADRERADTVAGFYPEMAIRQPGCIRVWPVTTSFLDVGTARDYLRASLSFDPAPAPRPSALQALRIDRAARTVIWPHVVIDGPAHLTDCIVAGDVRLPPGFAARSSIVLPRTLVREGDRVEIRGDLAVFPIPDLDGSSARQHP